MPRRRNGSQLPLVTLLPNMVTILGLCFGLTSIRFAFEGRFEIAAGLLVLAALVDGTDGLLARRLNAASPIGAELDSLSDFLCFGVAPALIVYHFGLQDLAGFGWVVALTFAICCCLRLARFNVMAKDEEEDVSSSFVGVPAPAGAMMGLFPVFLFLADLWDMRQADWLIAVWMLAVGGLMIARFRTFSLKAVKVSRENVVYILLAAAVVIGLMLTRLWLFCVMMTFIYSALLAWGAVTSRKEKA